MSAKGRKRTSGQSPEADIPDSDRQAVCANARYGWKANLIGDTPSWMRRPPEPPGRHSSELSDEDAAEVFADQARAARQSELTVAEREAFDSTPRLRGPLWLVLPLFVIAIVTLPIWGVFALSHHRLLEVFAAAVVVWRFVRWRSKRVS
jgi:hypothetical protein